MRGALTKILLVSMMLVALAYEAGAQRYDRFYDFSNSGMFVKKGTWVAGGTANYSIHHNDNYEFLVADNINSVGYKLSVSPAVCYMLKNNLGVGLRMEYSRNMFKLDTAAVNVAGTTISIKNYHLIKQMITTKAILRNYIPIGDSKRFAMFNET